MAWSFSIQDVCVCVCDKISVFTRKLVRVDVSISQCMEGVNMATTNTTTPHTLGGGGGGGGRHRYAAMTLLYVCMYVCMFSLLLIRTT